MDPHCVRKVTALLLVICGLARCEPPLSGQYGLPGNFGAQGSQGGYPAQQQQQQQQQQQPLTNSYGAPLGDGGHDEHQDYIDSQPKSYEFGYEVKDAASGNDFGRRETSDGETVRGEYRVQLPDGRTQIVTYTADWRTGFHADVRYEGVAQYPEQYGSNGAGGQAGYGPPANNQLGSGYEYPGSGNGSPDAGYPGNQGGYNNYQAGPAGGAGNNYNSNGGYNYQFGSNSIENGYGGAAAPGASYGPPLQQSPPQPAYGVPFH